MDAKEHLRDTVGEAVSQYERESNRETATRLVLCWRDAEWTWRDIADGLMAADVLTPRGKAGWSVSQVRRLWAETS